MTDTYEISIEGRELVSLLVKGKIPAVDSALRTLSQVARERLTESKAVLLLRPTFNEMKRIANEDSLLDQYSVANLVEKIGSADPECALDVLATIREKANVNMTVEVPLWGAETLTHSALVANLPWMLFQIAEYVSDRIVASRYIQEFQKLVALEDSGNLRASSSKEPRQLLKRLLCESKNSEAISQPAYDLAVSELPNLTNSPVVELLTECLLNPMRKSTEWVANWTISTG